MISLESNTKSTLTVKYVFFKATYTWHVGNKTYCKVKMTQSIHYVDKQRLHAKLFLSKFLLLK